MKKHRPKPRKAKRRSAPVAQPGLPIDGPGYFHGGQPDLNVGDYILPAAEAGTVQQHLIERCERAGEAHIYDPSVAYVSASIEWATLYAAYHRSGRGELYEVEPEGKIVSDPDIVYIDGVPACDFSYRCERARIVRKIKIPFRLKHRLRERVRAFRGQVLEYQGLFGDWLWLSAQPWK